MDSKLETTEYFSTQLRGMVAITWSKSFSFFEDFGLSRQWQQLNLERVNAELPWVCGWDSHQVVWLKYLSVLAFFPFLKILLSFFLWYHHEILGEGQSPLNPTPVKDAEPPSSIEVSNSSTSNNYDHKTSVMLFDTRVPGKLKVHQDFVSK